MLIVGISTSSPESSIAVMENGEIGGVDIFDGARSCVEELMPRLKKLLAGRGRGMNEIDMLAVDIGPGGLTGLKIGVVAVKTVAQALDLPVAPVSSMRALCHAESTGAELVLPIVRSTKKEFFSAIYKNEAGGTACVAEERLDTAAGLAQRLAEYAGAEITVVGEVVEQAAGVLESQNDVTIRINQELKYPAAQAICRIAENEPGRHWREVYPRYLCLSNAERNFGIRV